MRAPHPRIDLLCLLVLALGCRDGSDPSTRVMEPAPGPSSGPSPNFGSESNPGTAQGQGPEEGGAEGRRPEEGGAEGRGPEEGGAEEGLEVVEGCDRARLLRVPEDPAARGPWPVGARTVAIAGLTVEVWYPATPGSDRGVAPARYDIREHLPPSEQPKISDEDNPWQPCECFRDLPLDRARGPYPVIVFVHGTAAFRSEALPQMVHWASRGFVVLAADHPGLMLGDILGRACRQSPPPQDLGGDVEKILAALESEAAPLDFLEGAVDVARIGMAGHSAGGSAIAGFGDVASVLIPMAAGGVEPGSALRSTLILGATEDRVVRYRRQQDGYERSPAPKRLVGIGNGGHLTFAHLCALSNARGENMLEVAEARGVCGARFAGLLFDCDPAFIEPARAWAIIDHTTSLAFEGVLHCRDNAAGWVDLAGRHPDIAEYLEAL